MNPGFSKMLIPCAGLLLLAGCSSLMNHPSTTYETISSDPLHNTKAAQRANEKALELWGNEELPRAEKVFKKALAADVDFGPAHNNLGKLYFCTGNHYLAAWEFEYATKLMPDRPEPFNNLGLVLETVGKLDQAIEAYEKAYALASSNPEFVGNLARARLRRNEEDPVVRGLLCDLLLIDTRPDWIHWAQETLALGDLPCPQPPHSPSHMQDTPGTAEVIALPAPEGSPLEQLPPIRMDFEEP